MATLKERLQAVLEAIGLDMKNKANSSILATVAITGNFQDLSNKPILTGSTTLNSTEAYTNKSKTVTVTGAEIGDIVCIQDQLKANGGGQNYIIHGRITSVNTLTIYIAQLSLSNHVFPSQDPATTAWNINYSIIKK